MKISDYNKRLSDLKKVNDMHQSLDLMEKLLFNEKYPHCDRVSFNILIDLMGRNGYIDEMFYFFEQLLEEFRPDVRTFTSMLHATKKYRPAYFLDILQLMRNMNIQPTYKTMDVIHRFAVQNMQCKCFH